MPTEVVATPTSPAGIPWDELLAIARMFERKELDGLSDSEVFSTCGGEPCRSGAAAGGALRRATSSGRGIWQSPEGEEATETAG
jgi:hypothetical protein